MINLFFMSRDEGLTNDPEKLFKQYSQQKEKMRMGLIWANGDEDVYRIIRDFFTPEKFLKRLTLYFEFRNKSG